MKHPPTHRAWPAILIAALVALLVGAGSAWAILTVLKPADDPLSETTHTYVTVQKGEVGASISLNTVAQWKPTPVGANRASGVVTGAAVAPGDAVSQGSVLYTVDLRPVVVAQGVVPAFRVIAEKTKGPDVAQLQSMLADLGFYGGGADGDAGAGTVAAVKDWQESLGLERTGVVQPGDVIFAPTLPTRVSLDTDKVHRGAALSGGEDVVRGLPSSPGFTIPVTDAQAAMMPTGTAVQLTSPQGSTWQAVVSGQSRDDKQNTILVALSTPSGDAICGADCAQIPAAEEVSLRSKIVTVPTVAGLVVPSAALVTGADGAVAVIDKKGMRIPVTVKAAAKGMSVVEGVSEGLRVRVPADTGSRTGK